MTRFGDIEIPDSEAKKLSNAAIVARLMDTGVSRFTAMRIVEIERGAAGAPARARSRPGSRR